MQEKQPQHPAHREAVVAAAHQLFAAGVMSHSGHGNLSARTGPGSFLLTTVGNIRALTPDRLALVATSGEVLDGELAAENTEIVAMHSLLYRLREDIGAIIHTHSPAATAFAVANLPLPCRTEPLLRFGQAQPVPVVPWGPRGSDASTRGIEHALALQPTTRAVLLGNHGLLAFGPDPLATAGLVTAIEESAQSEIAAAPLGGARDFPQDALEAVRESMARGQHRTGTPKH